MTRAPGGDHEELHVDGSTCRGSVKLNVLAPVDAFEASVAAAVDRAGAMLERLDLGLTAFGRAPRLCRHFRLKEAVCAVRSRNPGLSLSEPVIHALDEGEAPPGDAVGEAAAYARALDHGRRESHRPLLSIGMLAELHTLLVANDRETAAPTPEPYPFLPCHGVGPLVEALDRWHRDQRDRQSPVLVAALAVSRLDAMRLFPAGNGRLARLIAYLLVAPAFTRSEPALYPSLYFARRESIGGRLLAQPRTAGSDAAWIRYFANGIATSARTALGTARRLDRVAREDAARIRRFGYAARSALRVHGAFQEHPVAPIERILETSGLRVQAATRAIHRLRALGIVREITHGSRHRIFTYHEYARILAEGTEPRQERNTGLTT